MNLQFIGDRGVKLILLDFGGTLFNLVPMHISCFAAAGKEVLGRSLTVQEMEKVRYWYGRGRSTWSVLEATFDGRLCSEAQSAIGLLKRDMIDRHISGSTLSDTSLAFLTECATRASTAVVSIGKQKPILDLLVRSGAPKIKVFGREGNEDHASKIDLIWKAMDFYHRRPFETLFIGDTKVDSEAATETGVLYLDVDDLGLGFHG